MSCDNLFVNMDSFQFREELFYLHIVWDENNGVRASFCICDDANCTRGISIDKHEFIPHGKFCGLHSEQYFLYRFLIQKSAKPQSACDLIVSRLIVQHRLTAFRNGGCDKGLTHDLLYIAARLAVEFKLRNNETLMELLTDVYGCEHSFDRLFSGVLDTPSYKRDFGTRMASIRVLKYLLAAARKCNMLFYYKGLMLTMPNVPLGNGELPVAVTNRAAGGRLVRDLLTKYGATPLPPNDYDSESEWE